MAAKPAAEIGTVGKEEQVEPPVLLGAEESPAQVSGRIERESPWTRDGDFRRKI